MTLLEAIAGRDRDALGKLLAEDVVFHSPVQTHRGRGQAIHLLVTAGGVRSRSIRSTGCSTSVSTTTGGSPRSR